MSPRNRSVIGDGDYCPLDRDHGQMLVIPGEQTQYCPHVIHDGRPKSHSEGPLPPSRKFWPLGHDSFRRAVIQTTLPEIDVALIGG